MSWLRRLFRRRESQGFDAGPLGLQVVDVRSQDHRRWEREAYQGKRLGSRELDALVDELITIGKTRSLARSPHELVKAGLLKYGEEGGEYDQEGRNKRGREIGEILFRKGGIKVMERVSYMVIMAGISESSLGSCWKYVGDDKHYWLP